ncbi:phosphate regulon sensor histidine kinase PhoR [Caviibacterium pharyngocola]|uniref:histidine kinase n=1 Tax=Caviibacterium pharyngocola TaxID=28159 RepID=A0A2M8RXW4_9PAST|nr:phosphate regulon sensor histidine kinase PhoR [Caviibacterium pharyngocola]PJG83725.1 PAS domain-containing sensor histidine kinase [Caviibacterium pharyngocola]
MKNYSSIKYFIIELIIAVIIALLFGFFAKDFEFWFIIILILLLVWHHYSEYNLLHLLAPQQPKHKRTHNILEYFSQSIAYKNHHRRRDKIQTLRMLSKLNKNIQYLPDGIILFEENGRITWCNQVSQQIFDFFWDKKVVKDVFNVIFYDEFKHYFNKEKWRHPLVLLLNNQRYIEININKYDDKLYLMIARDVTQFIRLLHSRQTFLNNMNHELRTPLTVIRGYLELLENDECQSALQIKALQAMKEQAERMAILLNQLNILAKIETSTNKEHQTVDLSQVILSLQKSIAVLNKYEHQIEFDIEPNLKVMGDESQLQSAVSNLIYNAIKHSGQNAVIRISWKKTEQGAEFSVSDNGVGIAAKHLPHLTERFYRVDESRTNQTGGTGLGLAIVKHTLEQHDSGLTVQSTEGKGATFSFIIKNRYLV